VYVATGRLAGTALTKEVSPVVVDEDNLLLGPSRVDVKRHQQARTRYWGNAPSKKLDRELTRESGPALCVALAPTPGALLGLCRVCSGALGRGRDVVVVELGEVLHGSLAQGVDPAREVAVDTAGIATRLPSEAPWSRLAMTFAASLWRLWCRRSPVGFSRFCAAGSLLHPQLANLGRIHAGFFPRAAATGLSLSRLDELILRQLSPDWQTPAKLFVNAMKSDSPLGAWLSLTGDLYLAARLLAWSEHTQGVVVERQKQSPARDSEMVASSFRWGRGGHAILDALPELQAAPPVEIGGAVAYEPSHPWVTRLDTASIPYVGPLRSRQ